MQTCPVARTRSMHAVFPHVALQRCYNCREPLGAEPCLARRHDRHSRALRGGRRVVRQDFGRCNDVELADDVVPCWGAKHIFAGRALRMRGGGEAAALLCIQWLWAGRILAAIPIFLQWLPAILHGCSMQMAALHRWGSEVTLQWGTHVESSRVNGTFGASS